jgi:hypothetical protein
MQCETYWGINKHAQCGTNCGTLTPAYRGVRKNVAQNYQNVIPVRILSEHLAQLHSHGCLMLNTVDKTLCSFLHVHLTKH